MIDHLVRLCDGRGDGAALTDTLVAMDGGWDLETFVNRHNGYERYESCCRLILFDYEIIFSGTLTAPDKVSIIIISMIKGQLDSSLSRQLQIPSEMNTRVAV